MLLFNTHKGMHHSLVAGKVGRREGPMRPKARGMAQHGGSLGWLVESDQAGMILYVMDGP
jgi:hypothetical protein